jgi:microcystin-dependent protein
MEKYLIFLITIIVIIIVIYCLFCNQTDTKDTFTTVSQSVTGIDDNNAIATLAAIARDLKTSTGVTIPGNLNVSGNLRVDGSLNFLPRGIIVAWRGSTAPSGWALCDGANGTPDLRGRFILGQGKGDDLTNRVYDTTGGAETVTLNLTNIPHHNHGYNDQGQSAASCKFEHGNGKGCAVTGVGDTWRGTDHRGGNSAGQTVPHTIMPPFYVLAYIMKL